MHWLQSLDAGMFRFVNLTLSNSCFDWLMPFLSGNPLFFPFLLVVAALAVWRGGTRGRVCLGMLLLAILLGDPLIVNTLKHAIGRPRPFNEISDAVVRLGRSESFGMPSAHAANWFAATMILFIYYRRSVRLMLPLAAAVGFSRVYNGVHYPGDVLMGAALGAGYGAGLVWSLDALWQWLGQKWFPPWWRRLPSLISPAVTAGRQSEPAAPSAMDQHWLRAGYVLIAVMLFARWAYLASGTIELSEDEAYQWLWSKHPALSYYSKPPVIAYTQLLGTTLWGDTAFGVRFFSPLIAAALGWLLLRFFAREVCARAGFLLVAVVNLTPLMAVGATLMTVDPLSVLFWTAAMLAGWRAVQENSRTRDWFWVGLWMGLGFLSKYTALFQWLCWAVFFALWPAARNQLRRPGPYLALLLNVLCALPVLIWNSQHDWITVTHVASNAGAGKPWEFTLKHFFDFIGKEAALLNPVFFIGMVWANAAFWRRSRGDARLVYCFSMGAPVFLGYLLFTFHSGVLPNWIAPAVLPLLCVMFIYWDRRWRDGARFVKPALIAGLGLGAVAVVVLHNTNLIGKITGRPLPPRLDPLARVRAHSETAQLVGAARQRLLAEGKPVFVIGGHYGITSLFTFYWPEAKAGVPDHLLAYYLSADRPHNQFYFWPGYRHRKGENAIFAVETKKPKPAPDQLAREFESVHDLGLHEALYRGRVLHTIQIFECRNLR